VKRNEVGRVAGSFVAATLVSWSACAPACPSDPLRAKGGAWSATSVIQASLTIVEGGMSSSACRLQVAFNGAPSIIAKAFVSDTSPRVESRYRARFYVDTTELGDITRGSSTLRIFSVAGSTYPKGGKSDIVDISLLGTPRGTSLSFDVADVNAAGLYRNVAVPLPNRHGKNRIEFDLSMGKNNPTAFRYWINGAAEISTDVSPTGVLAVSDNTPWTGVIQANLGAIAASADYLTSAVPSQHLYFDEFNSRRRSFIGQ